MERCREICLATRNKGKIAELIKLLAPYDVTVRLISDFTDHEPVEDGGTYIANATIKAKAAAAASGLPSLADDAGLEVDALPEEFGVESAPYVATLGGWPDAMIQMAKRIADGAPATARHCVTFVLCKPDGTTDEASAIIPGKLIYPGRGSDWGFNPYFIPNGHTLTYAEIREQQGMTAKNAASARGYALKAIAEKLGQL